MNWLVCACLSYTDFAICLNAKHSSLLFGEFLISSEVGVQQGDPLGPLLFCLVLQPILSSLDCPLRVGYMDDLTLGGPIQDIASAVESIISEGSLIGLKLNPSKCELIGLYDSFEPLPSSLTDFKCIDSESAYSLGAPLSTGKAMDSALTAKCDSLDRVMGRLSLLSSQDALFILRAATGSQIILSVLRAAPCTDHPALVRFDAILRSGLSSILNCEISGLSWTQASLPICDGGLGVRSVEMLAPSAFLASAATTLPIQEAILRDQGFAADPQVPSTLRRWTELFDSPPPQGSARGKQRQWDSAAVAHSRAVLDEEWTSPSDKARLLASRDLRSGDWLQALPISSCGLRVDDDFFRIAVSLRLGCKICRAHTCRCGTLVNEWGTHGLSCVYSAGWLARHGILNNIVYRALASGQLRRSVSQGTKRVDGRGWQKT